MDPEEDLESIPLDDGADLEAIPLDTGEPRRARRIVMGEGGSEEGARVEMGRMFDASEPLPDAPPDRIKGPASGPTAQQAEWWRRREEDRDLAQTSLGGDAARTILGLIPGARSIDPQVAEAPARMTRRARRMGEEWVDAATIADRPPDQSAGLDRRAEAFPAGMAEMLTLENSDELSGLLTSAPNPESYRAARDAARARRLDAQRQSPSLYAGGEAAGTAALMALPSPASGAGRIAMGAGLGALAGSGSSEADAGTMDHARDTALGALVGGGSALGAEALANPSAQQRLAGWVGQRADDAERLGTQARLEASGVWGGRAMREVDRTQGGAQAFAADLRRYGIGERGRGSVPVSTRAIDDAARLGDTAVDTMGELARRGDAAGARVPSATVIDDVERIASQAEGLRTRTARSAAQRLRDEFAEFVNGPDLDMSSAWRLRRHLDDQARWGAQAGDGSYVELVRDARQALDRRMDEAMMGVGDDLLTQWNDASRRAQIGAVMDRFGRGSERLSVGGGIQGASGAGDVIAEAVQGRNPAGLLPAMAQQGLVRGLSQYARLRQPGLTAVGAEAAAPRLRGAADLLRRTAPAQASIPVPLSRGVAQVPARRVLDAMARAGATRQSDFGRAEPSGDLVSRMLRESPETLGEYAQHFEAAQGDPQEIARIHYQLSQQDPEYRATIERARQER